ncbi:MAG TPA: L-threonylcarbamoyladenylate synthase [Longimicrobiales bacterium]
MIVPFRDAAERERAAERVAEHLRAGGLIAYPTETVYGFGCALVESALERLADLKGRGADQPFLLLVRGAEETPGLAWTDAARRLAAAFWPGPLTLALRAEPGAYPARVVSAEGTVAVRASPHPAVWALLDALDAPLTSTSVNLPGSRPARSAAEAAAVIRALNAPPELWLLDGGTLPASPPSTIVTCAGERPRVLRVGAIGVDALRTVVEGIDD